VEATETVADAEGKVDVKFDGKVDGKFDGKVDGKFDGKVDVKFDGKVDGKVEALGGAGVGATVIQLELQISQSTPASPPVTVSY